MPTPQPQGGRPLIFGEALVDVFHEEDIPGGAPFNVARHLAALGFDPLFVSRVGSDGRGAALRQELERFGMDLSGLQVDPLHATGAVDVIESAPGVHRFDILTNRAWDYIDGHQASTCVTHSGKSIALLYYGTLAQRQASSRAAIGALQAQLACPRWCDLNWRAGHLSPADALAMLATSEVLKVNEGELLMLLDWIGLSDASLAQRPQAGHRSAALGQLCAAGRLQRVVVTYGSSGYAAFERSGDCSASGPAGTLDRMVDTVGAGDAFTAALIAGALCDWPLSLTLSRANAFAGALCGVRGAAPSDLGFYASWRSAWGLPSLV